MGLSFPKIDGDTVHSGGIVAGLRRFCGEEYDQAGRGMPDAPLVFSDTQEFYAVSPFHTDQSEVKEAVRVDDGRVDKSDRLAVPG
jgi:hypothetical protein